MFLNFSLYIEFSCVYFRSFTSSKVIVSNYLISCIVRFMVERLFLQCIVPFSLNSEDRMKRLLTMFAYIDENSRKAFSTMLKAQTQ